mmetsp:Transcript_12415/g.35283  ORF Transcript_12415/g.35283 Transcript_12415/m.35283 type:complete len:274 (+) Transcript_12415:605-1426(+)
MRCSGHARVFGARKVADGFHSGAPDASVGIIQTCMQCRQGLLVAGLRQHTQSLNHAPPPPHRAALGQLLAARRRPGRGGLPVRQPRCHSSHRCGGTGAAAGGHAREFPQGRGPDLSVLVLQQPTEHLYDMLVLLPGDTRQGPRRSGAGAGLLIASHASFQDLLDGLIALAGSFAQGLCSGLPDTKVRVLCEGVDQPCDRGTVAPGHQPAERVQGSSSHDLIGIVQVSGHSVQCMLPSSRRQLREDAQCRDLADGAGTVLQVFGNAVQGYQHSN